MNQNEQNEQNEQKITNENSSDTGVSCFNNFICKILILFLGYSMFCKWYEIASDLQSCGFGAEVYSCLKSRQQLKCTHKIPVSFWAVTGRHNRGRKLHFLNFPFRLYINTYTVCSLQDKSTWCNSEISINYFIIFPF